MNLAHALAVVLQDAGYEERCHGSADLREIRNDQAYSLLEDPVGVVALLRQRPGVALYDHGQPHGDRLTDAAGTGLPDQEIRETHIPRNLGGEAFDAGPQT